MYSSYGPLKSSILPLLEVPDARADFVDQVLVVRHQQHRAFVLLERDVERVDRFEIQVVRRLVQHQEFGFCSISLQNSRRAASPPESASVGFRPSSPLNSICPSRPRMSSFVRLRIELVQPVGRGHALLDRRRVVLREVADLRLVSPLHRAGVDGVFQCAAIVRRIRQQRLAAAWSCPAPLRPIRHDLLAAQSTRR